MATLVEAASGVRARRAAEVEEMLVASHWAVLHGEEHDDRDRAEILLTAPEGLDLYFAELRFSGA